MSALRAEQPVTAATTPILEARGVSKIFPVGRGLLGGRRVLHAVTDVSLAVRPGSVLGIVGESGCGKSTLARMLLGLEAPSAGELAIAGRPLAARSRLEIASLVQPVFQDPYLSLNPRKKVSSIIGLPLRMQGSATSAEQAQRVAEIMERTGLPRRLADAYPSQLSGGQRQRVAIARALITRPQVVVCDEPTSALDVSIQAQILNLLQELRRAFGLTYVLISHNLAVVEHMATEVAVMYLGRIVEYGPARQIFAAPRHPYTRALLDCVLAPRPGVGLPALRLGATPPDPLNPPSGCALHPRCGEAFDLCGQRQPPAIDDNGVSVRCHLYAPVPRQAAG
jgi:peptide/nickel transport system ATP-binding protein